MRSLWRIIRGKRVPALSVALCFVGAAGFSAAAEEPAPEKSAGQQVAKSEGAAEAPGVNLLLNGDFEIPPLPGENAAVDFWPAMPRNSLKTVVEKSPSAHSGPGRQVLKLSPAAPGKSGSCGQECRLIEGADKYVFECYARGAGARLGLEINEWGRKDPDTLQRSLGTKRSEVFSLGPEWKLYRMEYQPALKLVVSNYHVTGTMYVTASFHLASGEAEVDDARFLAFGGKAASYGKIQERPWRGNRLGLAHTVPPPFVSVKVASAGQEAQALTAVGPLAGPFVLTCWGRAYRFAEGPLPSEIESNGASLLARPATFHVSADGNAPAALEWRGWEMKECQPDVVKLACDGVLNPGGGKKPLNLSVETTFEFDGMMRYDVTLQPKEAISLKEFSLEIPLSGEVAKLFHWQVVDFAQHQWRGHWGEAPSQAWHSSFSPTIWLGDQSRGLCWFAESPRSWSNKGAEDRAVEVAPSVVPMDNTMDALVLRINFINVATTVDAPRTWTFGLLATPAKPVPGPANQNVASAIHPPPTIGIQYVPGKIGDLLGLDPLEYYLDAKGKEVIRDAVRQAHAEGRPIMPWQQGEDIGPYPAYLADMPLLLERPGRQVRGVEIHYCYDSEGWREILLYSIVEMVKEYGFDGVYFDTGFPQRGCENPAHGCGYMDGEERWRPSYPYFGAHEFKKRLYRALYEVFGRQPYISTLMNGSYDFAAGTFDTAIVSGEEWNGHVSEDYRVVASLPQWEAQYNPTQWGVWGLFLPSQMSKKNLAATNSFLAFALLEHTPLWVSSGDMKRMYAALGAIDKLGPEAQFVPRWEAAKYIRPSSAECPASLYIGKNEAVIVLSNFGDAAVATSVLCDTKTLGWNSPTCQASDALVGGALQVSGNRIAVAVPANGFVLVQLRPGA